MARRTGTSGIIAAARQVCRLFRRWAHPDLLARTSPEFLAAVEALTLACEVLEAADNFPFQVDNVPPEGPED